MMYLLLLFLSYFLSACGEIVSKQFPTDFLFGVGSSAFQTEGAWNESGKGENIWDYYTHRHPEFIKDGSNADIACDSYLKFKEDVRIMKDLGVNLYRFSISWSRILPKGIAYRINPDGIRFYNQLINSLISNNIIPVVTMFHWDTPQPVEDLGGFASSLIVHWFKEYAGVLFEHFGDRVKYWITFNEPREVCYGGYGVGILAPGYKLTGIGDYMCGHNILKAHAAVYHHYKNTFKLKQNGKISIALDVNWYEPETNQSKDVAAAQKTMDFQTGWFADPIYSTNGDYPQSMKRTIDERSAAEGFVRSRLPNFSNEEIALIRGTSDYFSLNHYTTRLVSHKEEQPLQQPSFDNDLNVNIKSDPNWSEGAASFLKVVPWGFRKALNWVKDRYGDVEIIVTENGYADSNKSYDTERIAYMKHYLSALLEALYEDQVNVKGYTAWSLLDNFEWTEGYSVKFGLYHVNFSDVRRPRLPKYSALVYKEIITKRRLANISNKFGVTRIIWIIFIFILFSL